MIYEVLLDKGETPNKCTIAPLAGRPDFSLFRVKGDRKWGPLRSSILLHHKGECLTVIKKSLDEVHGIASVDCVWRRLDKLLDRIEGPLPILARIPDNFVTAYPRKSEKNTDPESGLATIEAIFVASALFGHWEPSLLSQYYFGRKFIEMNIKRFLELGCLQAADTKMWPVLTVPHRHSQNRRLARGKISNPHS